jgi:hypothetical protein
MKVKFSEKDMAALIGEVEAKFADHLAKADKVTTDLKKSEAAAQPKAEETPVVKAAEGFDYDEEDIKEMNEMYSSMTKAEATAHFESLKKTLKIEEKPEVKAEEVVSTKKEEVIAKSEVKAEDKDETKILKSEIETLKEEKSKLEKGFKDLTAALAQFVKGSSAPKQKAITKLEYVAKSEEEVKPEVKTEDVSKLDTKEVSTRLNAQIKSGKLAKAEREKINNYYLNGSKNIESIRHLLTGGK